MSVATTIRAVTTRTPLEKPTEAMIAPLPHRRPGSQDRKSTRLNSSHLVISYAVFCLKKKMFRLTCRAAVRLGLDTVNLFSGCPGDQTGGRTPNWVTCPWPPEYSELYDWQWNEVTIPY